MKQFYTLLIMLISFSGISQVETEITNYLNLECNATVCEDIQIGACPGDLNSAGEPYQFTDFEIKYVTETVEIQYNSITLRNTRLEFRNGSSLIDNGINIFEETDCDTDTNITEIVFIGGGNRFPHRAAYEQTLSLDEYELLGHKPIKTVYLDMLGKTRKDLQYASKGVYIKRNTYENNIVKSKKIIN